MMSAVLYTNACDLIASIDYLNCGAVMIVLWLLIIKFVTVVCMHASWYILAYWSLFFYGNDMYNWVLFTIRHRSIATYYCYLRHSVLISMAWLWKGGRHVNSKAQSQYSSPYMNYSEIYVLVRLLTILGMYLGSFLVVDCPIILSKALWHRLCHVCTPTVLSKVTTISLSLSDLTTLSSSFSESVSVSASVSVSVSIRVRLFHLPKQHSWQVKAIIVSLVGRWER